MPIDKVKYIIRKFDDIDNQQKIDIEEEDYVAAHKFASNHKRKGCAILRSANKEKNYKDIEVYDLQIQGVAQNVIKGL